MHRHRPSRVVSRWFAFTAALVTAAWIGPSVSYAQPGAASAALPACQLHALFPVGGKQGTTVEVKIVNGVDLERVDRLLFTHPDIKAEQKKEAPAYGGPAEPVANTFIVTIGKSVPPGRYDVRAAGQYGISNPRSFVVSQTEELIESPGNNSLDKATVVPLGSIVNGQANASAADFFKFTAKKGQRVLVDVSANRIDSKMDATLALFDASGKEIARNRNMNRRDPMIDFEVPADGEYVAAVYDFLYEGGLDHFYRLQIHTGPYIDFIFPPVGEPGKKSQFTLYGRNLPSGSPVPSLLVQGRPLEQLTVTIDVPAGDKTAALDLATLPSSQQAMLDGFDYQLSSPQGTSNSVLIGFATAPVVVEREPNNDSAKPQEITVPCEFVGRFDRRGDQDWLQFTAKKGDILFLEIVSQRLGIPTDPEVVVKRVVKDKDGKETLADVGSFDDDMKDLGGAGFPVTHGDGSTKFQAAEDGQYRVIIFGQASMTDPRQIYRLSIRQPKPDFRLAAVTNFPTMGKDSKPWAQCVRRGGSVSFDVIAFRRDGFTGDIEISAEGLPKGVTAAPVVIGAEQESVPLVIEAAMDAAAWSGVLKIVGQSKVGDQTVKRIARSGVTAWGGAVGQNANQPGRPAEARVCSELALAVVDFETIPVSVTVNDGKPIEMSRGGKLEVPLKVVRRDNFKEALTLTPLGLPTALKAQNVTIAANANDGKLTLDIPANTNPGTLSFYLRGPAKLSYKRDVAGAETAANAKKQVEKMAGELDAASKAAAKAKLDADAKLKQAQAALTKATDANRAELQKQVADADAAAKKATTDATEAAAKLKAANDAKTAADKKATDMANAAKPKDLTVVVSSTVGRLNITSAPITIEAEPATVKKGDKVEAVVTATRLYSFADQIDIETVVPEALKKVKITATPIVKGKNDTKLTIVAEKDAPPGTYQITVRGKPKFNNSNLQVEQQFALKVE